MIYLTYSYIFKAKHDYKALRKYESDWAIYEIMKGVLANYQNNQSRRRQCSTNSEKKTLSAQAEHNDEARDSNLEDDGIATFEGNSKMEDAAAGEIEGNHDMEDENKRDNYEADEISKDDADAKDASGSGDDDPKAWGSVSQGLGGDDDEIMDIVEREKPEPKRPTAKKIQKLTARKGVCKEKKGSNIVGEKGGENPMPVKLTPRAALKRSCKDVDNANLYEPKTLVNYQFFHSKYHTSKSKIQHFL
jgi:hypothetical protein